MILSYQFFVAVLGYCLYSLLRKEKLDLVFPPYINGDYDDTITIMTQLESVELQNTQSKNLRERERVSDNSAGVRLRSVFDRVFKKNHQSQHAEQTPQTSLDKFPELYAAIKRMNNYSKRIFDILRTQTVSSQLLIFFETIFLYDETSFLELRLKERMNGEEIADILKGEFFEVVLEAMTDDFQRYRFQIGFILSIADKSNIPPMSIKKIQVMATELEIKIQPNERGWYLCSESERRLRKAIKDSAILVVNEYMVVKFIGKLTALCINNYSSNNGQVFIEGNWYSPTDDELKEQIRNAFDAGNSRLESIGNWSLMRPIAARQNYSKADSLRGSLIQPLIRIMNRRYMRRVKKYIDKLPDKFPQNIKGEPRHQYRKIMNEGWQDKN